jgi:hypothetical protein
MKDVVDKTLHTRSAMGRAIQNKKAKERKRLRREIAQKEKETETTPPNPPQPERRCRSGELHPFIGSTSIEYRIDRHRGRRSKEATHRRYTRRAAKCMIAKIKAEKRIGKSGKLRKRA